MDELKKQIQRQLTANVLKSKCSGNSSIVFREAWCSQERTVRFTTPFFRSLFSVEESDLGRWKTGDLVMYEVHNNDDGLEVCCVYDQRGAAYEQIGVGDRVRKALSAADPYNDGSYILKRWIVEADEGDPDTLFPAFDALLNKEIPAFEKDLKERLAALGADPEQEFREGAVEYERHKSYERSRGAREACIAAHGTACTVCGIDFGKAYGPEFAGKIEVHHIVPISQIGRDYVVDPIKDLVPVCPNCHTALHSKKGGVYTVEELKRLRENRE